MKKSDVKNIPTYYQNYINLVDDAQLMDLIENGGIRLYLDKFELLNEIGLKTYAPGKWTVHQIIEHLIDTERLFIARSLRFVRNDKTDLPGYDENMYADESRSNERSIEELLEEYRIVRMASVSFFKNLSDDELKRTGTANGVEISVSAMGFIIIGHPIHHFNVIMERYRN